MAIDTVIFDYGGVVADDYCEPFTSELANLIGTDRTGIEPLISEFSDHGAQFRTSAISRDHFWRQVRAQTMGKAFSASRAQRLWAQTYVPNARMLHLLNKLKEERKLFVCVFSNMDADRFSYMRSLTDWDRYVDRIVVSCETRCLKPSEGAFRAVLQGCGRQSAPERVLFVDDRSSHLVVAERLGLKGYHFKTQQLLEAFLDSLPLVERAPES